MLNIPTLHQQQAQALLLSAPPPQILPFYLNLEGSPSVYKISKSWKQQQSHKTALQSND